MNGPIAIVDPIGPQDSRGNRVEVHMVSDGDAVAAAYDRIAASWRDDRLATKAAFPERRLLDRMVMHLPPGVRILDVGCGCGEPITIYLAERGFEVVGLDASERMLEFARQAIPAAAFVLGDMRSVDPGDQFDAIVAWDSVFHLPRTEHHALFLRFRSWLRSRGRLLVSLGGSDASGFSSQMHGETFFYSGHEPSESLALVERAGFRVDHWEVDDMTSRGHIAVLATASAA